MVVLAEEVGILQINEMENCVHDIESDVLASPTRRAIMEMLQEAGTPRTAARRDDAAERGLSASDTAAALGLHVTTARFHLERMVARRVRRDSPAARIRRPATQDLRRRCGGTARARQPGGAAGLHRAADQGVGRHHRRFTPGSGARGGAVGRGPRQTARPANGRQSRSLARQGRHGRRPARRMATSRAAHLGWWQDVELTLRGCPFLSMARAHPDVVCGIHRGLLRGASRRGGGRHRSRPATLRHRALLCGAAHDIGRLAQAVESMTPTGAP